MGTSKTESGEGRVIPVNERLYEVLVFWAEIFPERRPDHFVFCSEKYGASGDNFGPCAYNSDPLKPIGNWKEAWEATKNRAGVQCLFHDLRHNGCMRMLEHGVPFAVVSDVMG